MERDNCIYKDGWIFPPGWRKDHTKIVPMSGVCQHDFTRLRESSTTYQEFLFKVVREVESQMLKTGFHYFPDLERAVMHPKDFEIPSPTGGKIRRIDGR